MSLPLNNLPVLGTPRHFNTADNRRAQIPDTEISKSISTIFSEIQSNNNTNLPRSAHRRHANDPSSTNGEHLFAPSSTLAQRSTPTKKQLDDEDESSIEISIECSDSDEDLDDKLKQCMTKAEMITTLIKENPELESAYQRWKKIEQTETDYTKASNFKIPTNLLVGALLQISSFSAGAYLGKAANHWLAFPIATTLLNELFSSKAFQMMRVTNYTTSDMKILYDQQRYLGRAAGDLIRYCAGMPIKKKYLLKRNDKEEKVTAWEMVSGKKYLQAEGKNFLIRGLPFIWFTVLYEGRDLIIRFNPSAPVAPTLIAGLLAGALTLQTGQTIASTLPGAKENPNFSANYFHHKTAFEKKLLEAIPDFITTLEADDFADEFNVSKAKDLQKSLERDVAYGEMKSSVLLTYPAEVKQAFTKRREASSIEPEFSGSRTDTLMNLGGIFCSLLLFSYLSDMYSTYASMQKTNPNAPHDPLIEATSNFMLPMVLIFLGGFAFRDNFRIIPRVVQGLGKVALEVFDATTLAPIRAGCSAVRQCYRPEEAELPKDTITRLPTFLSSTSLNYALDHLGSHDKPPGVRHASNDINPDGTPLENMIEVPDSDESSVV